MGENRGTWREHYEMVYKNSGVLPAELENEKDIPDELAYLFLWFQELNSGRSAGMED